jgi:hypothetical protein
MKGADGQDVRVGGHWLVASQYRGGHYAILVHLNATHKMTARSDWKRGFLGSDHSCKDAMRHKSVTAERDGCQWTRSEPNGRDRHGSMHRRMGGPKGRSGAAQESR